MIRCHKCNIEKEDKFFQTYWHSTQQKHRTRKECTECMYKQRNERKRLKRKEKSKLIEQPIQIEIIQPAVPELEIKVKKCNACLEVKPLDKFYNNKKSSDGKTGKCIDCQYELDQAQRLVQLKQNGGSGRRYEKPNKYYDEYQKEATFNLLYSMGWNFNEDKGIWWKEGIKTEDGEFLNIKTRPKKIFTRKHVTQEEADLIVKLHLDGNYKNDIAEHLGISKLTVYKYIKKYENN